MFIRIGSTLNVLNADTISGASTPTESRNSTRKERHLDEYYLNTPTYWYSASGGIPPAWYHAPTVHMALAAIPGTILVRMKDNYRD